MINKAIVEGRLTKDVELRKTQNGYSVCTFTLASKYGKDKQGKDIVDFVECVAWNQNADFLSQYGKKGSLISVEGRNVQRSYEKDGKKQYNQEVNVDRVNILTQPKSSVEQAETKPMFDTGSVNQVTEDDLPW